MTPSRVSGNWTLTRRAREKSVEGHRQLPLSSSEPRRPAEGLPLYIA